MSNEELVAAIQAGEDRMANYGVRSRSWLCGKHTALWERWRLVADVV